MSLINKSGALITTRKDYWIDSENQQEVTKEDICISVYSKVFIIGMGGFGFKGTMQHKIHKIPERQPNDVIYCKTTKNQAIIYRLSGDDNPLHIDPAQSKEVGFDVPILHGMWTLGVITRAIFQKYCDNDQNMIKWVSNRFTSHVFPGETLIIEIFKDDDVVSYQAKTEERGKTVCVGFLKLRLKAKI